MQIGVNGRRLVGQRLGIGRYIEYMLKHWNEQLEPKGGRPLRARSGAGDDPSRPPS